MNSHQDHAGGAPRNERLAIVLSRLLVSVMLVCFASLFIQVGQRLAPGWDGRYLLVVTLLTAVEAFASRRHLQRFPSFSGAWFGWLVAEMIAILILLKAWLYLLRDPAQFWRDLPTWRADFIGRFFSGEYFGAVLLVALVWLSSAWFDVSLREFEGDADFGDEELRVVVRSDRQAARERLAGQIFTLGGVMIGLTALLRFDLGAFMPGPAVARPGVSQLLIYFVCGLALLGLSRFAVLRARWAWDRVPVQTNLASPWLIYSLLLLAVLTIFASFLPTAFSLGFLATLGYVIALAVYLVRLLFFVVMLIGAGLLGALLSLFGAPAQMAPPVAPPPPPATPLPPMAAAPTAAPWLDLLQALLFWGALTAVAVHALTIFLRQQRDWLATLRQAHAARWLLAPWSWLRRLRTLVARRPSPLTAGGTASPPPAAAAWGFLSLRRLDARQRVQFFYLALLRRGRERGLPRQSGQTPAEYAQQLRAALPDQQTDIAALTASFQEARYSRHEISGAQANLAQRAWRQIGRALRRSRA